MNIPGTSLPSEASTPYRDASESIEGRVSDLLSRMTLAEKVGQMTQIEKNSLTPRDVTDYAIGSVLSGGGGYPTPNCPESWAAMVRAFQEAALETRLRIPLLYGVDAVHGHNNMVGATIFPHNIGLGAARDADLVARVARVTARELLATNVNWNFAPAVSVPRDIRWGRTYEGFSEETGLVSELGVAYLRALQGALHVPADGERPVLGSVKHFIGDGATAWGSTARYPWISDWWQSSDPERWQIDQGVAEIDEATLRDVHLAPYVAAIRAGARNIMVSYSSWGGQKMHAHRYLLTGVLKGEFGFSGFLVSDWLAVTQLDADFDKAVAATINAGVDMVMVPYDFDAFTSSLTRAVTRGDVPLSRIDDAVRRILRVKFELGLFERPFGEEQWLSEVGSEPHRQVAREAVRQSLVLLKNERDALPIPRDLSRLLVAGRAADDIGLQCGGWTIEWQGASGPITPGTTLLQALRDAIGRDCVVEYHEDGLFNSDARAATGLIVLAEEPYAEGEGDRLAPSLSEGDLSLVERVRAQCDRLIVLLYSGRPLLLDNLLEHCDAFVAAWLPGTEGSGIADLLLGDYPFTGRLSYAWPRNREQLPRGHTAYPDHGDGAPLFPFGYGLSTRQR